MKKLLILTMMLAGCSTYDYDAHNRDKVERLANQARAQRANPTQYAYNEGKSHGCDSGSNATGNYAKQFQKDIDRYVKDQYYKMGWDDGFAQCKGQGQLINDVITNSF